MPLPKRGRAPFKEPAGQRKVRQKGPRARHRPRPGPKGGKAKPALSPRGVLKARLPPTLSILESHAKLRLLPQRTQLRLLLWELNNPPMRSEPQPPVRQPFQSRAPSSAERARLLLSPTSRTLIRLSRFPTSSLANGSPSTDGLNLEFQFFGRRPGHESADIVRATLTIPSRDKHCGTFGDSLRSLSKNPHPLIRLAWLAIARMRETERHRDNSQPRTSRLYKRGPT